MYRKEQKKVNEIKTIALVAHDHRKDEMLAFVKRYSDQLRGHDLCGTGTTARMVETHTDLKVREYMSGPLGGDQQIGALIAQNEIDMLFFFWDPLEAQPHDPDVKALLRIAVLYDIPVAMNESTAIYFVVSNLLDKSYHKNILVKEKGESYGII